MPFERVTRRRAADGPLILECQQAQLGRLIRLAGCYQAAAGRGAGNRPRVQEQHHDCPPPYLRASNRPVEGLRTRPQTTEGGYCGGKLDLPAISLRAKAALRALASSQAALSSIAGSVFTVFYCIIRSGAAGIFPAFYCYLQAIRPTFLWRSKSPAFSIDSRLFIDSLLFNGRFRALNAQL